jgi:hypothetical protein
MRLNFNALDLLKMIVRDNRSRKYRPACPEKNNGDENQESENPKNSPIRFIP